MANAVNSQGTSIHMGHGQMVDIVDQGNGRWDIVFSEAGKPDYKAPPVNEVEIEAIDVNGAVHPLAISAGENPSTIVATGPTENAHRARVRVVHGTHFHTREAAVPGKDPFQAVKGPNGGSFIALGPDAGVEVIASGGGRCELIFLEQGAKSKAPSSDDVVVEAIGPRAEDYQVRSLMTLPGSDPAILIASGKIEDATHVRVQINSGGRTEIRSAPLAVL